MTDNLDDYDFTPTAGTNLRSLFDNPEISEPSSLIYTAPKQPKPGTTPETKPDTTKPETTILCAKVVQVWKLTEGKYIAAGRHGCAIIGSSAQNSFEMILYKEKRNVIMRAKVGPELAISLKKDDFTSFYDSAKDNWLIKFNSHEDCVAMVSQLENLGATVSPEETKKPTVEKSDADSTPEKARSDILTRIAKMGQSILPNKTGDNSEENIETIDTNLRRSEERAELSPVKAALTPANVIQGERALPNTVVFAQPMAYDPFNVYVAESRAHNSELRMNLSHISEKLNCIMNLVDSGKTNHEPDNVLRSKIKVLELRTENLVRELGDVQRENAQLRLQMQQCDKATRDKELEMELDKLREQKKAEVEDLQRQILVSEDRVAELLRLSEARKTEADELREQLASCQEQIQGVGEIPVLRQTISELQQKLSEYEHQQNPEKQTDEKSSTFAAMLKEEMNGMYAEIVAQKDQSVSDVNSIIAQNIKVTTLRIIQNFQKIYNLL